MIVLLHGDRPEHFPGLKLAITSLRRCAAEIPIVASCPTAPAELVAWLGDRATVVQDPDLAGLGWNVKPQLLLWCLSRGHDQVIWLDADVIVTADPRRLLPEDDTIVVGAQEFELAQAHGSRPRTSAWGLEPGRVLEDTVNTAVLRVSQSHRRLIEDWRALLGRADYQAAQRLPAVHRPLHMVGDQDALTALLGSREFRAVGVHLIRRGREIAQCGGPGTFTPSERLRSLTSVRPVFIHSAGVKPWQHGARWRYEGGRVARLRAAYEDAHIRVSPYTIEARRLARGAAMNPELFGEPNAVERWLLRAGGRWPQLPELPLAVLDSGIRRGRARLSIGRYRRSARLPAPTLRDETPRRDRPTSGR